MKKRKIKKSLILFSVINLIFTILLLTFIIKLKVLPFKYLILLIILLLGINIMCFFFIKSKKKPLRIIGYIISVVLMIVSCVGSYYLSKTNKFLDEAFNNSSNKYTSKYYVLVPKKSDYEDINDIKDEIIGYYEVMPNISIALDKLEEEISFEKEKYDEMSKLLNDLEKEKIAATVMEESIYEV